MNTVRTQSRNHRRAAVLAATALVSTTLGIAAVASPASAASTLTVTSTGDAPDAKANGVCATAAGVCTLRAALQEAARVPGHATIAFAIPGAGPFLIEPATKLPALGNPAGITIDGFTQAGARPNTDQFASNALLKVQLKGKGPTSFDGLTIGTAGNTVRGLALYGFAKEFSLDGANADNNTIVGNHICTNAAGTIGAPGVNTSGLGLVLNRGADHNTIGAPGNANRNVISGCHHRGVVMSFGGTAFNKVQNNIIGLTPSGGAALPNRSHGVDINYTGNNLVGGSGFQEGNVISGNQGAGIEVSHSRNTRDNQVIGNFFGTGVNPATVPPYARNGQWGVRLEGPKFCDPCTEAAVQEGLPSRNTVSGNVIVNNAKGGLMIDKGQHDNAVRDNKIGVTRGGTRAPNSFYGIRLEHGAFDNTIGPGNEIAYNPKGITSTSGGSAPPGQSQPTYGNRFTANSIHDASGLGIDLAPFGQVNTGGVGDPNVNGKIQIPVLTGGTRTSVSGTACNSCRIEVFRADTTNTSAFGEGVTLLGTGVANESGKFTVALNGAAGAVVSATATNAGGSTSEFSKVRKLPA